MGSGNEKQMKLLGIKGAWNNYDQCRQQQFKLQVLNHKLFVNDLMYLYFVI